LLQEVTGGTVGERIEKIMNRGVQRGKREGVPPYLKNGQPHS
jgi:hypothetical protein